MKKVFISLFALAVLSFTLNSCTTSTMPGADEDELRDYITKQNPYEKWSTFPGTTPMYKGKPPHGAVLTTFVNDKASESIKAKSGMADGSIIVKENYSPEKKLMAITAMYKVKGYNPDGGDWFWVKYNAEFETQKSGNKGCVNCHGKQKDNDYIFLGPVK